MGERKKRVKRRVVTVPQSLEEAADFVRRIGQAKREIEHLAERLTMKIDRLKAVAVEKATPREATIEELFDGLFVFAQAHREALSEKGRRKTVVLSSGQFGWRMPPSSVHVRGVSTVIARLESLGLDRFLRVKKELNKEAILAEPYTATAVEGIVIQQEEEFFVKPEQVKVEVASSVVTLKKTINGRYDEDERPMSVLVPNTIGFVALGVLVFHETITPLPTAGIVLGVLAVTLLSI